MIKRLIVLITLLALLLYFVPVHTAEAVRGTPGSSEFGFGAHVDLGGQFVEDGILLANNLHLDWVSVEFPWSQIQPNKGSKIDWTRYDSAFQSLAHYKINVLANVSQPPAWAETVDGPDAGLTLQFTKQLLQRYDPSISAMELFPAANTQLGWGAKPNPAAYMKLFKSIAGGFKALKNKVLLVAGGLAPIMTDSSQDQFGDLEFLQQMYDLGAKDFVQVLSIQLHDITGAPAASPSQSEHRLLRHYEEIREVMLHNDHSKGILWITGLSVPSNLETFGEPSFTTPQKQASWLSQAFQQLRSQLYIGVAFLDSLNPASENSAQSNRVSLITLTGDLHPAYRVLRDEIAQNSSGGADPRPGRSKSETLAKGH